MSRRLVVGVVLALAFGVGVAYGWRVAFTEGSELLFDSAWWLVFLAPFAGILAAGLTRRRDPVIEGDKVLRHDDAAILEHWTHGIGTAVLLVSGIGLGFFFIPRYSSSPETAWAMMNIHFVAVVFFLFGTFYYAANTLMAMGRLKEHLPTKNAFSFTVRHYGRLLGFKRYEMPPEDKYFESERMAYLLAVGASALIVLTGLLKALAHVVDVPAAVMAVATPVHDASTLAMLAFFVAHVFFAAVLPASWPMLRSMVTGYVSVEHAKKDHAGWYERLAQDKPRDSSEAA